VNKSF